MSTYSRITDDDMKYFQFKARDRFLLQKEDLEWEEFCKIKGCSYQHANVTKSFNDVGVQACARKSFNSFKRPLRSEIENRNSCNNIYGSYKKMLDDGAQCSGQSTSRKTVENEEFSSTLTEIKSKLEQINITLSEIKQDPTTDSPFLQQKQEELSIHSRLENNSAFELLNEQRKSILRSSLLASLQKMHSFAALKSQRPLPFRKEVNCSFVLPNDLQKQRQKARKAYLASLKNKPEIRYRKIIPPPGIKRNAVPEKRNKKSPPKYHSMPRKKIPSEIKKIIPSSIKQKEDTLIQLDNVSEIKDENIEQVVDDIVDDLVGEEIMSINRIKQKKLESKNISEPTKMGTHSTTIKNTEKVELHKLSPESYAHLKRIPFFNLNPQNTRAFESVNKSHSEAQSSKRESASLSSKTLIFKDEVKINQNQYQVLYTNPASVKNITKHRKLYWQYLEQKNLTKTHNFDPQEHINMAAESLLNDCITDICEELNNLPSSVIMDLMNMEFTPTL